MAKDGPLARLDRSAPDEPNLSDLLDPVALEERLKEARARRAEALARRDASRPEAPAPPPPPAVPPEANRPGSPAAPPPLPVLAADPRPAAPPRGRRALRLWPAMLFLAGLGGGAVAVLGLQMLPGPVADAPPQPTVTAATTETAAPEPAAPGPAPEPAAAPPPAVAAAPSGPAPAPDLPDATVATPVAFTPIDPAAPASLGQPAPEATPTAAPAGLPPLDPPPPVLPPPAAQPAALQPPAPAPAPLPARVFIHYPRSAEAAATAARDALLAGGVAEVDIVPVRLTIDQSNIRYYHDGDRDAAGALSALIGPSLPDGPPVARDFTDYPTPPASGKVEVWLAGTSDSVARRTPPPQPAPAAPLVLRPTAPAGPPASQAQAVERILIERTVERLLEQGRPRN